MGAKHAEPGVERKVVNRLPARLPRHLRHAHQRREWRRGESGGRKDMPFTQGTLCTKVARYLDRTYSSERVLHPLKRVGAKGEGRFERISWDEALSTIAAKFKEVAAIEPQSILPCSYAGTMGLVQYASMDRRFFHRLGASLLERTLCSSAGKVGLKITLGGLVGMDPERFEEAKLILIWGSNPIVSNLHLWSRGTGGEAPRRQADRDRPLSQPDCSEMRSAPRAHAGHRRGAGAGHDACDHQRGPLRRRLRRAPYPRFRAIARARARIYAAQGRCPLRSRCRSDRGARARIRGRAPGGDPAQLRHAAPLGRRHGGAYRRLPARAYRALARCGRGCRCPPANGTQ